MRLTEFAPILNAAVPNSPGVEEFIARLYKGLLGRAPDAPGLSYWLNDINLNGIAVTSLGPSIEDSPEFQLRSSSLGLN